MSEDDRDLHPWSGTDGLNALGWALLCLIARAPLVARIEGVLDHDQSVVGLMALDISGGRRYPLFFDGQRYMGAIEAYVAAGFVRLFGHEPNIIALAPLLFFGIFVAGQYAVWRLWQDRMTGHLAAGLTTIGSPMLALWGIIPRGGYIEFLAWALPTLAIYRTVASLGGKKLSPRRQVAWGFLLGLGYLLNPLSLTVYVTLAIDWFFVRHGADLRAKRLKDASWLDSRRASLIIGFIILSWIFLLAFCCHVDPHAAATGLPYIAFEGFFQTTLALPLGAVGVVLLLGVVGWWSQGPSRLYHRLNEQPWTLIGIAIAFFPFLLNGLAARLGMIPLAPSLPVWIGAPWRAGANARTLALALGSLIGSDSRVIETVLIGQGVEPPPLQWIGISQALSIISAPLVVLVLVLMLGAAVREQRFLRHMVALRGVNVSPPIALVFIYLCVNIGLFLLQGTSPNRSSIRYLLPIWVALPGVLACSVGALSRKWATLVLLAMIVPWCATQVCLWHDLNRVAAARPLAEELQRRGIKAIVASPPVALIVAKLTHGKVGAVEFRAIWPRLGDRYLSRVLLNPPLICVVDRRFPWTIRGEGGWAPEQDFESRLMSLAVQNPGRASRRWELGPFEVWEVDLPLNLVLGINADRENWALRPQPTR